MATDYDAPRKQDEELREGSLEQLKARRSEHQSAEVEEDEVEAARDFELPGTDLSNVELSISVIPTQNDEFTCSQCSLVYHRSQLAHEEGELPVCTECAGQDGTHSPTGRAAILKGLIRGTIWGEKGQGPRDGD